MRLTGNAGDTFELNVVGYEFPEITSGGEDSNWLNVQVTVTARSRSWTATDPCLMTDDIAELVDWLEAIAAGQEEANELEFLEPNLSFRLTERKVDRVGIRVSFELELRPAWAKDEEAEECDIYVDLAPTSSELRAASRSLREQHERWPPRP